MAVLQRFWWVIALIGIGAFVWIRARLREAARAAMLRQQLDLEIQLKTRIRESDTISRTERREFERDMEVRREQVVQRKAEMERAVAQDTQLLADAWNRAFGSRRGAPPPLP